MDLFLREAAVRIDADDVLSKIGPLIDWRAFSPILRRGLGRSGSGPQGYDPLVLFKCLLIGQWHGLSDPKLERALKVRLDFMVFCGLGLHAPVPDETTHCRFRNALVKGGVYDDLLRRGLPPARRSWAEAEGCRSRDRGCHACRERRATAQPYRSTAGPGRR